jgi:hypothetical protein
MPVSFPKGLKSALNLALTVVLGVLNNKASDAFKTSTFKPEVVVHCSGQVQFRA